MEMIIKMKQPKEESSWEVFQRWPSTFHQEIILSRFEPKYPPPPPPPSFNILNKAALRTTACT